MLYSVPPMLDARAICCPAPSNLSTGFEFSVFDTNVGRVASDVLALFPFPL